MGMTAILLWLLLAVLCWPLALLVAVLYPLIWLICLPFRVLGFVASTTGQLISGLFTLPFRMLRASRA
jgi:hypothetical protein